MTLKLRSVKMLLRPGRRSGFRWGSSQRSLGRSHSFLDVC